MKNEICVVTFNIIKSSNVSQKQIIIVLYFIYLKYENIIYSLLKGILEDRNIDMGRE